MNKISRRAFLWCSSSVLIASAIPRMAWSMQADLNHDQNVKTNVRGKVFKQDGPDKLWKWSHEGYAYRSVGSGKVMCGICPNRCILDKGDRSVCRSKTNYQGKLYSLTYGNPCAVHVDPIEKKPLYHFKPQTNAFSIATTGCNFRCLNCQNYEISQAKPHDVRFHELMPPSVVDAARRSKCRSIAYTYSEPITFFEYMLDTARLAKTDGLDNLLISNGYINRKPLLELGKVLDGANINLKAYSDAVYRKLNGGRLQPVLNTLKTLDELGIHVEITNLVVPGYVDDPELVRRMCAWILDNLGPNYPLHFLRFFPRYRLDRLPPTPVSTLDDFRAIALKAGIRYVYIGNVPRHEGNHTFCHHCGKLLVKRLGYTMPEYHLKNNRCRFCDTVIPGVWSDSDPII